MPYHTNNIGQVQLDDFVMAIPRIYARLDEHRSISDSWLHANHHAAAIGEEVRKEKPGEMLLQEIADFAMWLFTVLGKLRGEMGEPNMDTEKPEETLHRISHDFSDLLWNKYPGMCPVCYWRRTGGDRKFGFWAVRRPRSLFGWRDLIQTARQETTGSSACCRISGVKPTYLNGTEIESLAPRILGSRQTFKKIGFLNF